MRILGILLSVIALLSALVSAFLFFWWIPLFISHFVMWDVDNPINDVWGAYTNSNFKLLTYLLRDYFATLAGLFGWIALIALCRYAGREWKTLPRWISVGCLFGAASVLTGPYHFSLAIPPISLALSILGQIWLRSKVE